MSKLEHYSVDRFYKAGYTNVYPVPTYDARIANKVQTNQTIDYGTSSCYYDSDNDYWRWLREIDATVPITEQQSVEWSKGKPKVKIACGKVIAIEILDKRSEFVDQIISILDNNIGIDFIGRRDYLNQTVLLYKTDTWLRSGTLEYNNGQYFGQVKLKGLGFYQPINCLDPYKKDYIVWEKDVVSHTVDALRSITANQWKDTYRNLYSMIADQMAVNSFNNELMNNGAADQGIIQAAKTMLV